MYNRKKEEKKRKENSISNWSRKQDDVPTDIQPQ